MTEQGLNLGDIPDLSGIGGDYESAAPFNDGWYKGNIIETRSFTDSNGNDRVFNSTDEPSQKGDSRNIKLQVVLKRTSDGRELNISYLLNYRPEDLTQEAVQAVIAETERTKASGDRRTDFRPFLTLQRLGQLQKVAGVRQFQRSNGGTSGLDLSPLFGKTAYFKVIPDDRNEKYKQIGDVRVTAPKVVL